MNVLLLIGNARRHYHIAKQLKDAGMLAAMIVEERETFMPSPDPYLKDDLKALFKLHFNKRAAAEQKHFEDNVGMETDLPHLKITREELNSEKTRRFIQSIDHDVAISYGVHLLTSETINSMAKVRWNIHGGLSPWYKGCITLFWPSYMMEPNLTGMTIHELTQDIDGGAIVHHSVPTMMRGDGIHDLACRSVKQAGYDLPSILGLLECGELTTPSIQKKHGKLWTSRDWSPAHLRMIYQYNNDDIIDQYLDGKLPSRAPKLKKQF